MKKTKIILCVISLMFSFLVADDFNYDNALEWENHPYKNDPDFPLHFNYYHAYNRWKEFNEELDWYIETDLSYTIQHYKSEMAEKKNLSEDELEISKWILKREQERYKIRCEALDNLRKSLECFLENAVECIYCTQCDSINFVGRRDGYYMRSVVHKDMTDLLTHYLEKKLFPEEWKEKYLKYQNAKNEKKRLSQTILNNRSRGPSLKAWALFLCIHRGSDEKLITNPVTDYNS